MPVFTVVLLRNDRVADLMGDSFEPEDRIYVATGIEASESMLAVRPAKEEAMRADRRDLKARRLPATLLPKAEEYHNIAVFHGVCQVALFGFATGGQG